MRIGIDVSALAYNKAGTATYIRGLLQGFKQRKENKDLRIIELCYSPIFNRRFRWLRLIDAVNRDIFWISRNLPKRAALERCDLVHSPAMLAPAACGLPIVITIFDLYVIREKSSVPLWVRTVTGRRLSKIIRNSKQIIAISQFTKKEILDIFPSVDENKITVTPLGINSSFRRFSDEEMLLVKSKYGLMKPYILTVATIEPRKNLKNLLRAYALVKNKLEHDLIIVGPYGWKSADHRALIHQLQLEGRVKYFGYVDKIDLPGLYSAADVFIYPSLYEGFGLPPLEAMSCGCPVVTSNCSSLPEIVGDAALLINPTDIEQISQALKMLAGDEQKKSALRAAGLKRARIFSWEKCAEMTVEVYERAIAA